jgi:GNAT superfamily N-acetyltransferase
MWWRLTRAEFSRTPAAERRLLLKDLVDRGEAPGILAYVDGEPVGWCSLGPRESFPALERSRTLKRIDDRDVWSIVCFFVAKEWRGQGLMKTLIDAGVAYAGSRGATAVEAYPSAPAGRERNTGFAIYMGVVGAFVRAGFVEVAHPGSRQYIMRRGV